MREIKGGYKDTSLQPCIRFHVRFLNLKSLLGKYGVHQKVFEGFIIALFFLFVILFSNACIHYTNSYLLLTFKGNIPLS